MLHSILHEVTQKIVKKSASHRAFYLAHLVHVSEQVKVARSGLSCTNLAHSYAALPDNDKIILREQKKPALGIISAYNDILSAHQPFERFPQLIKEAVRTVGGVAHVAAGVPAMCDGVTQGQVGMELSLFSRDTIARASAIGLSHNMFDAAVYLGVCDKIVPGLLIGALHFGHLPAVFIPAGPMPSGMSNPEKARLRQLYAMGQLGRDALLEAESKSYHAAGTCTFYGTANSNQILMEVMGLHLPGSAFVSPNTALRDHLTQKAAIRALEITQQGVQYIPVGHIVDEKSIVNAMVALLATGGSTNHTIHLVAIAKAAGIVIDWTDFDRLSQIVPLLCRMYPNGEKDVNFFHAAGGVGFLIRELLEAGLLHEDVMTVLGRGLRAYCAEPFLLENQLVWRDAVDKTADETVLRSVAAPFSKEGGLSLLMGNLGWAIMKLSAVDESRWVITAPAKVFDTQGAVLKAYQEKKLECDCVVVLRYQGPRANGMPELHALMPALSNLQDLGYKVALVTDGRLSGASGKVPAAIHVCPEALAEGYLKWVEDGDIICVDGIKKQLTCFVSDEMWVARKKVAKIRDQIAQLTMGRPLFAMLRREVSSAKEGATTFDFLDNSLGE
jgi:phosphogluconate dehydratase